MAASPGVVPSSAPGVGSSGNAPHSSRPTGASVGTSPETFCLTWTTTAAGCHSGTEKALMDEAGRNSLAVLIFDLFCDFHALQQQRRISTQRPSNLGGVDGGWVSCRREKAAQLSGLGSRRHRRRNWRWRWRGEGHQVRLDRGCVHEVPAQHLGGHAFPQVDMGRRPGMVADATHLNAFFSWKKTQTTVVWTNDSLVFFVFLS